jgi:hypothetical protein
VWVCHAIKGSDPVCAGRQVGPLCTDMSPEGAQALSPHRQVRTHSPASRRSVSAGPAGSVIQRVPSFGHKLGSFETYVESALQHRSIIAELPSHMRLSDVDTILKRGISSARSTSRVRASTSQSHRSRGQRHASPVTASTSASPRHMDSVAMNVSSDCNLNVSASGHSPNPIARSTSLSPSQANRRHPTQSDWTEQSQHQLLVRTIRSAFADAVRSTSALRKGSKVCLKGSYGLNGSSSIVISPIELQTTLFGPSGFVAHPSGATITGTSDTVPQMVATGSPHARNGTLQSAAMTQIVHARRASFLAHGYSTASASVLPSVGQPAPLPNKSKAGHNRPVSRLNASTASLLIEPSSSEMMAQVMNDLDAFEARLAHMTVNAGTTT